MTSRRARVILVIVVVAGGTLAFLAREPLYEWVATERVHFDQTLGDDLNVRGYRFQKRWGHGGMIRAHGWYTSTGFLRGWIEFRKGRLYRQTTWSPDGTVLNQLSWPLDADNITVDKTEPPWLWGVTDQAEPSMPAWMKDDAKWRAALEAQ